MSDNLFSFPGESTGQDAGDFFGGAGGVAFTDLGSADEVENPFTKMTPPTEAPASGEAASVTPSPAPGQQAQDQLGTTQTPPPAAPPAVPASAETPKTPPAQTTEETNPLLAAMDLQEKKNAAKTAAPIFAQLPVFSYNGSEEPIENVDQTFEELRLAKADDFPEFDEAQSISWTVTYGKIVKNVATPRKTKIGNLKREIESSKEFMDALKKAADKRPKCIVKPKVAMQKKGECAYKGIFPRLADARASEKTISFIPAQDGRVYERRVTGAGEFITPTSGVRYLDDIKAGFAPALPLIPYGLMEQAVTLFRCLMDDGKGGCPLEALVHIYWDREEKRFFLHVPTQKVGKEFVDAVLDDDDWLNDERYLHYADLHSHNDMPAEFSPTDDRDERANRVYMVMGRLNRYYPELSVRVCNGGHFCEISPAQVLEPMPEGDIPLAWLDRIKPAEDVTRRFLEAAA